MKRDIIIVDQFYSDPDAVVEYAKRLEYIRPYETEEQVRNGTKVSWEASRFRPFDECPFKSSEALLARLEFITGERIDRDYWRQGFPLDEHGRPAPGFMQVPRSPLWNGCFHAKYWDDQKVGAGVHNHVTDVWNYVGEEGWVGLIYLNKDAHPQAGLRTWVNRDPARNYDWMTAPENWTLIDTFANVYNRLILHRGHHPHSGAAGWGNSIHNGRFYQTFFFRTLQAKESAAVSLLDLGLPRR